MKIYDSFGGKKNSCIEYKSRRDKYENLSLKEYLDMIRPYLRDLINYHKTPMKLSDKVTNNESQFGEWKIQLIIQTNVFLIKILKKLARYIQVIT